MVTEHGNQIGGTGEKDWELKVMADENRRMGSGSVEERIAVEVGNCKLDVYQHTVMGAHAIAGERGRISAQEVAVWRKKSVGGSWSESEMEDGDRREVAGFAEPGAVDARGLDCRTDR